MKSTLAGTGGYALLVHGGAGQSEGAQLEGQVEGCRLAVDKARRLLEAGAPAIDVVQCAVEALEDDARFNAGTGGSLTSSGTLELDASIMEGTTLRAGAVCSLPPFRNPIAIARAVLDEGQHVLYAGEGARAFALARGFTGAEASAMITERARRSLSRVLAGARNDADPSGTVGAVARDEHGRLAAATSTGGITGKRPGRVGDSPIVGAGTYAEDDKGAASATGTGEGILRVSLCVRVIDALGAGAAPADAAYDALLAMQKRTSALGGLIVVTSDGRLALARTTHSMAFAASWEGHGVIAGG